MSSPWVLVFAASMLFIMLWLRPEHYWPGHGKGKWTNPPRLVQLVFRRGEGDLHWIPLAGQIWMLLTAVSGVAWALSPSTFDSAFAVSAANGVGLALVVIASLAALLDRPTG
jgi:hypothetical protein